MSTEKDSSSSIENNNKIQLLHHYGTSAQEFSTAARSLQEVLDSVNLKPHQLSKQAASQVETLATVAVLLSQRTTELSNFYSSLNTLEAESNQLTEEEEALKTKVEALNSAIVQATATKSRLQRVLKDLHDAKESEIQKLEEKRANIPNLTKKGQEYADKARKLEKKVGGIPQDLECSVIERLQEEYEALMQQIHVVENKVVTFQDLPPDLVLARLKLSETQQLLYDLSNERDAQLKLLTA